MTSVLETVANRTPLLRLDDFVPQRIGSTIGLSAAVLNVVNFLFSAKTTALATTQFSSPPSPPTLLDTAGYWDGKQTNLLPVPDDPDSDGGKSGKKDKRSLSGQLDYIVDPSPSRLDERILMVEPIPISPHQDSDKRDQINQPSPNSDRPHLAGSAKRRKAQNGSGLQDDTSGKKDDEPSRVRDRTFEVRPILNALHDLREIPIEPTPGLLPARPKHSKKQKRGLVEANLLHDRQEIPIEPTPGPLPPHRKHSKPLGKLIKRRLPQGTPPLQEESSNLSKRLLSAAVVGMGAGALLSPGLPSTIMHSKSEAEKPPFDPYDPNMLKPKDDFAAAAADPNSALPAPVAAMPEYGDASGPPALGDIKFPASAYRSSSAPASGGNAVLRKRSIKAAETGHDTSSSALKKRFIFGKGPGGVIAGGLTLGSILPLLYGGVSHARWRTKNPRDRDILKELDDTPTYGAIGVPDRQPGQLATNAMPGYNEYVAQLEAKQAAAQQQSRRKEVQQVQQPQTPTLETTSAAADDGDAEPVLRRRGLGGLEKRNKWLIGGGLAVVGGLLGYLQSATQFPSDRDEEKDKKKKEAKRKQQEAMEQQQQQGAQMPPGLPSAADPSAMGATAADPFANIPSRSLDSAASPPLFGSGAYGDTSSAEAMLNAAAGYQAAPNTDSSGGSSVLKKRSDPEAASVSKRGIGSWFSIAGTTMFLGTLAGNLIVSSKQKKKPVPLVTPNADTRGPVIPGGDLYTQYLESKRGQTSGAVQGGAAPASVNFPAAAAAAPATAGNTGATIVPEDSNEGEGGTPVLKKRGLADSLARVFSGGRAVEAEAAASSVLTKSGLLTKGAAVSEAGAGALSKVGPAGRISTLSRFSGEANGLARGGAAAFEAGYAGLGRAGSMAAGGDGTSAAISVFKPNPAAWGSAKPAMLSDVGKAGQAGAPATLEGLAGRTGSLKYTPQEILQAEQRAAASAGGEGVAGEVVEEGAKKGSKLGWKSGLGIVGTAAGATMTFNGIG